MTIEYRAFLEKPILTMLPYNQEDVIHSWVRPVPRLTFRRQTVLFSTLETN